MEVFCVLLLQYIVTRHSRRCCRFPSVPPQFCARDKVLRTSVVVDVLSFAIDGQGYSIAFVYGLAAASWTYMNCLFPVVLLKF